MKARVYSIGIFLAIASIACATHPPLPKPANADAKLPSGTKPRPQYFNMHYGPHERNVLDIWQAKTVKPAPALIFLHGGGFVGGDKWTLSGTLLKQCLDAGITVCSANYRYSTQQPFPGPMLDGARVVQFLRAYARELHIDPARIALSGNSAGAGMSLWIAFHDDMAAPAGHDFVAKQSTRVTCVAVYGAQCSYDPRWVRDVVGGRAYEHPALPMFYGLKLDELDTPKAYELYEQAAAINYLTKDDPPVIMFYGESKSPLKPGPNQSLLVYYDGFGKELPGQDKPGQGIHHPKFGYALKEKMDPLGIECIIRLSSDYPAKNNGEDATYPELVSFLKKNFGLE